VQKTKFEELKPYAGWTNDCQGKQDFDGPIISISTRYWPGPEGGGGMLVHTHPNKLPEISTVPYGSKPSAHSAIILRLGPPKTNDGGGDYLIWKERGFEADTEAQVKAASVEQWCQEQIREIVSLLGGVDTFHMRL